MTLIDKLKAAERPSRKLDALICKELRPDLFRRHWGDAKAMQAKGASDEIIMRALLVGRGFPRLTASLDAALTLAKEFLPRWDWSLYKETDLSSHCATLTSDVGPYYPEFEARHKSPAIALLIALLSAIASRKAAETKYGFHPNHGNRESRHDR